MHILCRLFSLSLQYGWLLFCSKLLRDWPLFFVGNNSLTVAFTLFSQIMLLITYFIWKLFTHSTQNLFSILLFIAVLHSQFFTCCRYSREVSTNEVYLWTGKWSNSNWTMFLFYERKSLIKKNKKDWNKQWIFTKKSSIIYKW